MEAINTIGCPKLNMRFLPFMRRLEKGKITFFFQMWPKDGPNERGGWGVQGIIIIILY